MSEEYVIVVTERGVEIIELSSEIFHFDEYSPLELAKPKYNADDFATESVVLTCMKTLPP